MSAEKIDYRPLKFLDLMEGNNHIVLLYQSEKHAYLIITRYLLNGLKKGDSCIFFAPDSPEKIEQRIAEEGIDVDFYKHKDSLRIHPIERSDMNKIDALGTLNRIRNESTKGMRPPYRFVGRTITDTESREGMRLGLTVEKSGHEHFDNFDCSQMCYYDISKLEKSMRHHWISLLLKNHHHAIYASEPNKAVAFETTLLEYE